LAFIEQANNRFCQPFGHAYLITDSEGGGGHFRHNGLGGREPFEVPLTNGLIMKFGFSIDSEGFRADVLGQNLGVGG